MKFGVLVESEEGLDWAGWRRTYQAAERLGFDSVWISDHWQSPWSRSRHGLDAWTALSVAAAETERVLLGPLVSPITFREPAILARMAESLADLSHGRLVVGLGLGWNADEHTAAGIAFPSTTERSRRLAEAISFIRRELGERRVPVLIGGKGRRSTLPVVARCADEWNLTTSSPDEFRAASAELDRLCGEIGRDPGEIRRSVATGVLIGRDTVELKARGERLRALVEPLARAEDLAQAARLMGWVVGTPGEVISSLRLLANAGVERAIFGHYDTSDVAALELIAAEVAPALA